jgi:hypothetical protein
MPVTLDITAIYNKKEKYIRISKKQFSFNRKYLIICQNLMKRQHLEKIVLRNCIVRFLFFMSIFQGRGRQEK